jgi:hypothetical protein
MRLLALLPLAVVVACSEIAAPPAASPARVATPAAGPSYEKLANEKDEILAFAVTACNGELVLMDGTIHFQFFFSQSPNGGANIRISANYHLQGQGTVTGAKYVGDLGFRDREFSTGENATIAEHFETKLIGQGKVPDLVFEFGLRVHTVDGDVRTEHVDMRARCDNEP